MKVYYIVGIAGGVVLFFAMWAIMAMASCSQANRIANNYLDYEVNNTVELRYYMDDDYNDAEVIFVRVHDKNNYTIPQKPSKEGYNFVGLYDSADPSIGRLYVSTDGHGLVPLTGNIILYPVFEKIGG